MFQFFYRKSDNFAFLKLFSMTYCNVDYRLTTKQSRKIMLNMTEKRNIAGCNSKSERTNRN